MIIDTKNKVYHRSECSCLRKVSKKNQEEKNMNIFDFYVQGFKPCSVCSPLLRQYEIEKDEIRKFCVANGLSYRIRDESLLIDTYVSSWKIIYTLKNRRWLRLYHENTQLYYKCNSVNGEIIKSYHNQESAHSSTILGYLKYIVEHDNYKYKNSTRYKKMNKNTKTKKYLYDRAKKRDEKARVLRVCNVIEQLQQEKEYQIVKGE